jgi:hypothetical protein
MTRTPIAAETAPLPPEYTAITRIVKEGYGSGAWHGPDLRTALEDVGPELAFWRPAAGRHNVAEIAVHHAWYVRSVIEQLSGEPVGPFPLPGDDWFTISTEEAMTWPAVVELVERLQEQLSALVDELGTGRSRSPLPAAEVVDLVLGITCHAVYHAGQVQLLKVLARTNS